MTESTPGATFLDGLPAPAPPFALDEQLRSYIQRTDADGRTWAERVVEKLVSGAADGDARSLHEVFSRVGAPPKSDGPAVVASVDEALIRKLLEFVHGSQDHPAD